MSYPDLVKVGEDDFNAKYATGARYKVAVLSKAFNATWIHKVFDDEEGLAECRNAAIDFFLKKNQEERLGLGWCFFADPDEIPMVAEYEMQSCLKRCSEINDVWGYLHRFRNILIDGNYSTSHCIRLFKLHPLMRMKGRIHEGFEESIKVIIHGKGQPNITTFPVDCINQGCAIALRGCRRNSRPIPGC